MTRVDELTNHPGGRQWLRCDAMRCDEQRKVVVVVEEEDEKEVESSQTTS